MNQDTKNFVALRHKLTAREWDVVARYFNGAADDEAFVATVDELVGKLKDLIGSPYSDSTRANAKFIVAAWLAAMAAVGFAERVSSVDMVDGLFLHLRSLLCGHEYIVLVSYCLRSLSVNVDVFRVARVKSATLEPAKKGGKNDASAA